MAKEKQNKTTTEQVSFKEIFADKSTASVVIATVVLLLVSFFAFRFFGDTGQVVNEQLNGEGAQDVVVEEESGEGSEEQMGEGEEGSEQGENGEQVAQNGNNSEQGNVAGTTATGGSEVWEPTNYEPNSQQGENHTVVTGDTLWEIAEAYYGNGGDWVKIADANGVGYLANGNPLIMPGQVLSIP